MIESRVELRAVVETRGGGEWRGLRRKECDREESEGVTVVYGRVMKLVDGVGRDRDRE